MFNFSGPKVRGIHYYPNLLSILVHQMRWVILETPYDDNQIPEHLFSRGGYTRLLQEYERNKDEIKHDPDAIRNYVRAYYWDDSTGKEEDIEGLSWFPPEDSTERMD